MNVPARLFLVLCLLPLGTGCASWCKVKISRSELDRQFGELGLRYVAREDGFTLWSHYTRFASPAWVEVVAAERAAVIGALGGDAPVERVQVVLVPVEGLAQTYGIGADGSLEVRAPAGDPTRGLGGWADEQTVNVHVPAVQVLDHPERGPITSHAQPEGYRRTLRHELAHWRAFALGIEGGDWLEEGLAQLVEGLDLEDGRLVDRGTPRGDLTAARAVGVPALALDDLLDWREDMRGIVEAARSGDPERELGVEPVPRTACGLYVRFLLDLRGDGEPVEDLAARLRELGRLSRAEHLAGESRWRAWLSDELAHHASAAPAR